MGETRTPSLRLEVLLSCTIYVDAGDTQTVVAEILLAQSSIAGHVLWFLRDPIKNLYARMTDLLHF